MGESVTDSGRGPVLLMLHAHGLGRKGYAAEVEYYSRSYRVIAPDFRGHGDSERMDVDCTLDDLAQDVIEYCDQQSVDEAVIIGWSMGTAVGAIIASHRPQLARAMVLLGAATPVVAARADFPLGLSREFLEQAAADHRSDPITQRKAIFEALTFRPLVGEQKATLWDVTCAASTDALISLLWSMIKMDQREILDTYRGPILAFHGVQDLLSPVEKARWLGERYANVSLEIWDKCGHSPHLEFPERFRSALDPFLAEVYQSDQSLQAATRPITLP